MVHIHQVSRNHLFPSSTSFCLVFNEGNFFIQIEEKKRGKNRKNTEKERVRKIERRVVGKGFDEIWKKNGRRKLFRKEERS